MGHARHIQAALVPLGAVALSLLSGGCGDDAPPGLCGALKQACQAAPATGPAVSAPWTIVPGPGLPASIMPQAANNNLDIIWWDNRLFLAFRTAPTHFASPEVRLHVASSPDGTSWTHETSVHLGRDLREPRFLVVGGQLFLYFAVLGQDMTSFEPDQPQFIARTGPAAWTPPAPIFQPGFIPWRGRTRGETNYLVGYRVMAGASGASSEISLLATADGRTFVPALPHGPVILDQGGETDFAFTAAGDLVTVTRVEGGLFSDGMSRGVGSLICRLPGGRVGERTCRMDPRKFDSPLVIEHGQNIFLVARRNATATGAFDLMLPDDGTPPAIRYAAAYWDAPKRCALWLVDPASLAVSWVLDLPSNGDTCFASAVHLADDRWLLFDYSSPLEDPTLSWRQAQVEPTRIYAVTARLPAGPFALPAGPPPPPQRPPGSAMQLQCGPVTCTAPTLMASELSLDLQNCCPETGGCGMDTTAPLLAGFLDVTLQSVLGFATTCLPIASSGAACGLNNPCTCPDHTLNVTDVPGSMQSYTVPLTGCCRADGRCGYLVDLANSQPSLPLRFGVDLGCIDPMHLAEADRGPAAGRGCLDAAATGL